MPEEIREIRIANPEDIRAEHICTAQETLTEIRVSVARLEESNIALSACVQEISARFEEHTRQLQTFMNAPHRCSHQHDIERCMAAVEFLKEEHHKRNGQAKWEERIINVGQAVLVAAVVAVVLFLMKGGSIG